MNTDTCRFPELCNIEFKNLYEEIKDHSDKIHSIITLSILSTGAYHGAVLSLIFVKDSTGATKNIVPGLFLLPLLFILPSIILVTSHLRCIVRIASYIQIFFEEKFPNEGIGWQKNVQGLRMLELKNIQEGSFRMAISCILPGLAFFCIGPSILSIMFFYHIGNPVDSTVSHIYYVVVAIIVVISLLLTHAFRKAWSAENFGEKIHQWKELRLTQLYRA